MSRSYLPHFDTVYDLHVKQGLSYAAIAKKYNVDRSSVCNKLKRGALQRGLTWPLEDRRPRSSERDTKAAVEARYDLVKTDMVRAEIDEFLMHHPTWTKLDIAKMTGLAPSTVYDLTNHYTTVSRSVVQRVMNFIVAQERASA